MSTGTSATSPATAAAPTRVACPAVDVGTAPAAAWKGALSALRQADTSTYRIVSESALPDGHITVSRSARVDVAHQLAEFSASIGTTQDGHEPSSERLTVVVDDDVAYMQTDDWTDERKGKWMRLSAADPRINLPFAVGIANVPPDLAGFVPERVAEEHGNILVRGRVPAERALSLFGLGALALRDPDLTDSLRGHVTAIAVLGSDGCLKEVGLDSRDSRVTGSSAQVPAEILDALVRSSTSRLFISSVGTPQQITVPPAESLLAKDVA